MVDNVDPAAVALDLGEVDVGDGLPVGGVGDGLPEEGGDGLPDGGLGDGLPEDGDVGDGLPGEDVVLFWI